MRRSYVLVVALLGVVMVVLPTVAGSVEPTPNITAHNEPGVYSYHSWMPATATVSSGGVVKFSNLYTTTYHGLKFTGGTAGTTPSCTGIPQQATEPIGAFHWEGECTFSKVGTYTFVCTVHPTEMKGTITVTNGEPTVTTEAATSQTEHEATLHGTVNPNGKPTEYFFKWGTTESYGEQTTVKSAGAGITGVLVPETLKGLAPGTLYHFKLVAKNEKGPAEGEDRTFTTTSPPGPPPGTTGEPALSPPANPAPPIATPSSTTPVPTIVPMAPIELPSGPLLLGSPSLRSSQRGSSVRGSAEISTAGVGGRLEVDLLASGASLAKAGHSAQVRVGRLVRSSLYAGNVSFAVPLNAKGKGTLRRKRRLALTVKIVLTPLHGAPVSTTRSVVLHA